MPVDFQTRGLGIRGSSLAAIRESDGCDVIKVAGAYAFGMSTTEAVRTNVESAQAVAEFAATLPNLRRLVHLSGYRVGGQEPATEPWSQSKRHNLYKRLGAYEGSKVEADAAVQALARQLNIPLTVVNPATVTFVPVVPVDYLARFLALVPTDHSTQGKSYWVLDDNTPTLTNLLTLIGNHYQVPVPRLQVPVGIVKMLPPGLSGVEPETLSFLSSDRYPTHAAQILAQQHGLIFPDTISALNRWADYLARHHFGSGTRSSSNGGRERDPVA